MSLTVRQAVGSLLVVGLSGTDLTSLERAWLKLVHPAGIILFKRNIVEAKQTRALLSEATACCVHNAFRCVDVEGGLVDRLRDALAPMPSAQAVTAAALQSKRPTLAFDHGVLIARAVCAFGFNTTLAPVLDLGLPASASVMGTRVAASTPDAVIVYARSFLGGLATHGVVGCGKHFPGLGGGALDSHIDTPAIERGWRDLWLDDLAPYRTLRDELPMIMVNHAAYPRTRSKSVPASISSFWITSILRKRIGYRGIIFSDDLEMGGILTYLPIEDAAVAAVRAGMDVLEICHSPELILRAYEALIAEGERSPSFRQLLLQRVRGVARQRSRLFAHAVPRELSTRQLEALRSKIHHFHRVVVNAQPAAGCKEVTPQ
jgi:beta-N-acetylhexosaminidase